MYSKEKKTLGTPKYRHAFGGISHEYVYNTYKRFMYFVCNLEL